ncbi:uncharacterized protein LOC117590715 [Drosophila guanche]|uniref:DUF4777 domain-containing protein n=1 Tax=Drosophila guanche TaxID=7266 RepID=A0A3B0KKQ3_DROGU|nr:uncharacterized protein LOC117590715 [Drosophila guanche]SPP89160.1 Hypothetical predicted protein [Drosophila guanche]
MTSRPRRKPGKKAKLAMQNLHISPRCTVPQRMAPPQRKLYLESHKNHTQTQIKSQTFTNQSYNSGRHQWYHPYPYQAYCNRANRFNKLDNVGDNDRNPQWNPHRKGFYNFRRHGEQSVCNSVRTGDSKDWRSQNQLMLDYPSESQDLESSSNQSPVTHVKYPIVPMLLGPSDNRCTAVRPRLSHAPGANTMKATERDSPLPAGIDFTMGLVAKPTCRATPMELTAKRSKLNAAAPEFQPGLLTSQAAAQVLLGTPVGLNATMGMDMDFVPGTMAQSFFAPRPFKRYHKQPMPDLFRAVLALVRDSKRSVSYPEIINTLMMRLQRPELELKRHVPHALQLAVQKGYLSKQSNRYALVSEMEHFDIMRRNHEADLRAKELENEPLSWRKR